jgi:protein phosphatase
MELYMYAIGFTDTGRVRSQNQDAIYVSSKPIGALPNLFIVADGMGGHKAGDVASHQAVERFCAYIADAPPADTYISLLTDTAHKVNQELYDMAQSDPGMEGMGTTFTACVIDNERVYVVHVGDSRAYFINAEGIERVTDDHTYAEEMYRAGEITFEEARTHPKRHHLTRVLGFDPHVVLDSFTRQLSGVASILLCTDGLSNMLDDSLLYDIISHEGYAEVRAQVLVDEANHRGGTDNISALLIDLRGGK